MIKLLVAGVCGRMGVRIASLAVQDPTLKLAGVFESQAHACVGKRLSEILGGGTDLRIEEGLEKVIDKGDVLIDFTNPQSTLAHAELCAKRGKGIVIGTTGLSAKDLGVLKQFSKKSPVLQSPNMSAGVNLLFKLTELVASKLGEQYEIEIVEAHHRNKKDAPSGTALELARQAACARGLDPAKAFVYGREGMTGERSRTSIGIHAVRGGDIVGEHTVSFLSDGERVELVHKASSRDAFAKGALLAAKFLAKKKTGFYSMQDVLGL